MIKIEIQDQDVLAAFNELARRESDLTPVTREIANTLLDHTEENFAQQGRPRWPDLAPSTIRERTRLKKWPGPILQRSAGGLAAAVTPAHDAISAALTVAKPYARIHQRGGQAGRGRKVTIPPRPYLPITAQNTLQPEAEADIVATVLRYLRDSIPR